MAAAGGESVPTLAESLFAEGFCFDFFQAVRLMEKMSPNRTPLGYDGPPATEVVRFRVHNSLTFPPSEIYQIEAPNARMKLPVMSVAFMGLTGPSGVLPRHYTERLMLAAETKGPERYVVRDWFDLFNHRLISLFYRAWTKYRYWLAYERGEYAELDPDIFTESLYCLIGMGARSLRKRLHVSVRPAESKQDHVLARVDDLALVFYSGFLSHRPRCAISLERMLEDYFGIPIRVLEFQGQWLQLDPENQSQVGTENGNNALGANVVVGARVWDIRSKIRIRMGPLTYPQFASFLPDQSPNAQRKLFFTLMHLVRLYVGPEIKVEVQLILKASEIPACKSGKMGARLGWDSWVTSRPRKRDSDDAVFAGISVTWIRESKK